ncbi:hypothetical protein ASPWEDRAFT_178019 [Aspergillus wentii DTO 134E9]|uniref:Uncharacterized protein n=1 Tax=Aspergillus wentii DTO 134E9 TaxID=1073089 RepID=A0A1L9RYZ6_ASPWE|nr:uncharacterized protein ASPWEDRAFT_178019 [Aspergillus wentii DTO 134E9]OJJ40123.1 hypothetical protein ASPWEDRAFT_178019 [Aspergillus wentii DTO 134E9]
MWFRRRPERRDNHESRTFDDWRAVMRCTTSVRSPGFLNPFLSGFTLIEKVMLIGSAQSACLQNDDDSRWLEAQFEQAGQSRLTQVVRYYAYRIRENRGEAKWSQSRIELETCLHWAAQREIYIQEEVSALRKSCELNTDNCETEASRLKTLEDELTSLNETYYKSTRQLWRVEAGIPTGPLKNGFPCLESRPQLVSL